MNIKIKKNDGEVFAVFMDKRYINGKILCYSCYDDTHFECDISYINNSKDVKDGKTKKEVLKALGNRGYNNIVINN